MIDSIRSKSTNQIKIWEIPFTTLKQSEIIDLLAGVIKSSKNTTSQKQKSNSKQLFWATPNPEMLLASEQNTEFKNIIQNTDLNLPDGNGLIWANIYNQKTAKFNHKIIKIFYGVLSICTFLFHSKNEKKPFNKAIHGSDLMQLICLDQRFNSKKFYFLGGATGIALQAAKNLQKQNPKLQIVGTSCSAPTDPNVIKDIQEKIPDILFVAYGAPKQEIWIKQNLKNLSSVKLAMGVGGSFDFIAGSVKRAPIWLQKIGLEWLYRLILQPKTRIKRILNAFIVFPYRTIKKSLKSKN